MLKATSQAPAPEVRYRAHGHEIRDARGRWLGGRIKLAGDPPAGVGAQPPNSGRAGARRSVLLGMIAVFVGCGVFQALAVEFLLLVNEDTRYSERIGVSFAVGVCVSGLLAIVVLSVRYRESLMADDANDVLSLSKCACCGYRIAEVPVHRDGCVVCPECSAAWRLHEKAPIIRA